MKQLREQRDDLGLELEIVQPEEINIYDTWVYDERHWFIDSLDLDEMFEVDVHGETDTYLH